MPSRVRRALCWIRRDLRLSDHAALAHATSIAEEVAVAFVFDPNILDALEDRDDRRVTFIHRSLQELDRKLHERGSALVVRRGDPLSEIPGLARELGADCVVTARDYEPYARQRDEAVRKLLADQGTDFTTVKDSVVMEPGQVLTQDGGTYRVYTPYSKMWRAHFSPARDAADHAPDLTKLVPKESIAGASRAWSLEDLGFDEGKLWLEPGEDAALQALSEFSTRAAAYGEKRDFPAGKHTSALSVHFRFGTISIREAVRTALELGSKGADKWLAELIWREFYQDVLFHNPQVVDTTFNPQYAGIEYPGTEEHFRAWCEGRTGYPLVDAAMRCLNQTGWMHNRLRMVVASFLTKDLLVDYRQGEAYFARKLLDFELASNNGGWQWAASVGADAQPYFRIFNPILQSLKFDPDGEFIREWVPELRDLKGKGIHWPLDASSFELLEAGVELGKDYPWPIVHHDLQRPKAIALLESARK